MRRADGGKARSSQRRSGARHLERGVVGVEHRQEDDSLHLAERGEEAPRAEGEAELDAERRGRRENKDRLDRESEGRLRRALVAEDDVLDEELERALFALTNGSLVKHRHVQTGMTESTRPSTAFFDARVQKPESCTTHKRPQSSWSVA